jgi:hypothetical protein
MACTVHVVLRSTVVLNTHATLSTLHVCAQAAEYDNMQKLVVHQDTSSSSSSYNDCAARAAPALQASTPVKQSTDTDSDCLSEPHTQRGDTPATAVAQRPGSEPFDRQARRRSSTGINTSSSSCVDASITSSLRSFASYGELRKAALMITAFQVHIDLFVAIY